MHFRHRVSETLTDEREAILKSYWPDADGLLRLLTRNRAVITGEAALAFLMRDRGLLTDQLEICVAKSDGDSVLGYIDEHPVATRVMSDEGWSSWPERPSVYVYDTVPNRSLRVTHSHTYSPFTPITKYRTTALMNYFDEFSFGCAYRDFTLNRCSVVPALPWLSIEE